LTTITIQKGQTLSRLAKQHHTSVATLAKLNDLKDPNKIIAGKKLIVSQDTFTAAKPAAKPQVAQAPQAAPKPQVASPSTSSHGQTSGPAVTPRPAANPGDGFDVGSTKQPQTAQQTKAAVFTKDGRTFPSSNGYPLYAQNKTNGQHEPWAKLPVGNKSNVGAIGCAMTAVTMGISGISGQTITPDQTNKQVNKIGGFTPDGGLRGPGWSTMGGLTTPPVKVTRRFGETFNADKIDKELAAGRPVVVEVDYKIGHGNSSRKGHDQDGDHWILITGKTPDGKYLANDPAGGKQITLNRTANGQLETPQAMGKYSSYITTGQVTTFDRGPAKRATTPASTPAPQQQPAPAAAGGAPAPAPRQPATTQVKSPTPVKPGSLPQPSAEVEKAIRDASSRFGLDYGYMKAKAYQESSFKPTNRPGSGTATGLYQFTASTWLQMVKTHGADHGLRDAAAQIQDNPRSRPRFTVADPAARQQIMNLRNNGALNAMMAGEYTKENQGILQRRLGTKPGPTELYLAHFLGPDTAAKFLADRQSGKAGTSAASMLPAAAAVADNRPLFYADGGKGRAFTAEEFYQRVASIIVPKADAYNRTRVN
jgi:LysM repeat protein